MSDAPLLVARVSTQLRGSLLLSTLQSGQVNLLKVEQQLSTGQKLNRASDDPAAALGIESLKRQIAANTNFSSNLDFVSGFLSQADNALGTVSDLINQAKSIASSQLGAGSSPDERASQAEVVNSLLSRALSVANTRSQGQAIFGGQNGVQDPFGSVGGGYKYQGTSIQQGILTPTGGTIDYTVSGDAAFGAVSSQVVGYKNLTPSLTTTTRLSDVNGARLKGISPGQITATVGATSFTIDLSQASTAGDVVNGINAGLSAAGSTATVALSGGSIAISGDAAAALSFSDIGSGTTAADLGLTGTVPAATSSTGAAIGPRITGTTTLASLNNGAGINASGITISNGANAATITLAGPPALATVEDLVNVINNSGTFVQAQIKDDGTGINLFNPLSGTELRVGENGGTTADDLGIRSLNPRTNLSGFNNAGGVTPIGNTVQGPTGNIVITRTDGTTFNVKLDGVSTPSQLLAAINNATGNTTVTAALNATGNGLTLTDTAGGSGNISVTTGASYISNGTALGILGSGTGGTLAGTNIAFSTDDLRISRRDGSSFTVSLKGTVTVQDVLDRINNADGNTTSATHVTAALNSSGNGIQLSDASTGSGLLTVTSLNASAAAEQLGINKTAPGTGPGVITGDDTNPLMPQGLFSSLTQLRDALLSNDNAGIAQAAALLETDGARVIKARGIVGAREQDVAGRKDDATNQMTNLKQALSLLAETDFTEAATRFQQLNTAYQGSLQVAQASSNLSLLDFLK